MSETEEIKVPEGKEPTIEVLEQPKKYKEDKKSSLFGLGSFFSSEAKLNVEDIIASESKDVVIRGGIIFSTSHLVLNPYRTEEKDVILVDGKYLHIESGTLLILVQDPKTFMFSECISKDADLLKLLEGNPHLMHNGNWWVNLNKKEGIVKDKKYRILRELVQ